MPKTKVEEIFDKYAKGYSSNNFAPARYETSRAAMSFADDITWHFLTKYLPKRKSIRMLDAGGEDDCYTSLLHICDVKENEFSKSFKVVKTN